MLLSLGYPCVLRFDLCHFGFFERRPTRAVTNLPLESWDGKLCTHSDHPKLASSAILGIRRPDSMLKEIAASLVRTLSGSSVARPAQALQNPLGSDFAPSLGQERPRWTAQGAAPAGSFSLWPDQPSHRRSTRQRPLGPWRRRRPRSLPNPT